MPDTYERERKKLLRLKVRIEKDIKRRLLYSKTHPHPEWAKLLDEDQRALKQIDFFLGLNRCEAGHG